MGVPVPVICCLIAGIVIVLIFCGAFFVELFFPEKNKTEKVSYSNKEDEFDIDEMLSKLEQKTKVEEESKEEEKVTKVEPIIAPAVVEEKAADEVKEKVEQKEESTIENDEEPFDFDALFKQLEQEAKNSALEEQESEVASKETQVVEEAKEEAKAEEVKEEAHEEAAEEKVEEPSANEETEAAAIVVGPDFDYNVRIETIKNSQAKLEKDLAKATREVNKYEKTGKRKERNEKLLDRKSAELTNLNLVLYSVNSIEDIDPEKKKKQEDLIEHITELKNSIESANEYLEANKEKYANSKKIKDFLSGEKARYEEELLELEQLIQAKKNK